MYNIMYCGLLPAVNNSQEDAFLKIDVSQIMNHRLEEAEFSYTFDPEHTDVECAALPEDIVIPSGGISVVGRVKNSLGCMMFESHVTVRYGTMCARCLDDIEATVEFDVDRVVLTDADRTKGSDHMTDDGEWDGVVDDTIYVNDAKIIPDADIMEELALNLPPFTLCSEDCPGLCPKCGAKLSDGDCGCKEEKFINPKIAVLKQLLDDNKD